MKGKALVFVSLVFLACERQDLISVAPSPSIINFVSSSDSVAEDDPAGIVTTMKFSRPAEAVGSITIEFYNSRYGNSYTTEPASRDGTTINFDVVPGDTEASFRILPLNNSLCADQQVYLHVLTVSGSIREGNLTSYALLIQDDDGRTLISFSGASITVMENNASGVAVQLLHSRPAPWSSQISVYISDPGSPPRYTTTPPMYGENDYWYPSIVYSLTIEVVMGTTSSQFQLTPFDNALKDGDKMIYFWPSTTSGCLSFTTGDPFTITLKDDD